MNFLLVNDDGIDAPGLRAIADALKGKGNLYVCAPEDQRSGHSHSISLSKRITIHEVTYPGAVKAWHTSGTPADCTKVGVQFCNALGAKPDVVFSGINSGSNMGEDTLYSGTIGAAHEAAMLGYHGIALSVDSHDATHYEAAATIGIKLIDKIMELPTNVILSVNTPDLPIEEIKGVRVAKLGTNYFRDSFVEKGGYEYALEGYIPDWTHLGEGVDIAAAQMGFATVTPLGFDFTEYTLLDKVKEWGIEL